MEELRLLLVQNQNNLDKLRVRSLYCLKTVQEVNNDSERLQGAHAEYWEDWQEQLDAIAEDLHADIKATALFVNELREFIIMAESKKRATTRLTKQITGMLNLAKEAKLCQIDMINMTDEQLLEHRDFTHKLFLVEVIDSLNED